jgi:hypothetical protein
MSNELGESHFDEPFEHLFSESVSLPSVYITRSRINGVTTTRYFSDAARTKILSEYKAKRLLQGEG